MRPRRSKGAGKIGCVSCPVNVFRSLVRRLVDRDLGAMRRGAGIVTMLALVMVSSLVGAPADAAPHRKAVAAAAPTPPTMRLGDAVRPLAYDAELTIVPTQDRFTGHLVIHVEIGKPTDFFWLNAKKLDIRSATLVGGGKTFVAKTVSAGRDYVGMRFAETVPAGRAVLTFDYDGAIDRNETTGVFRQQDGDNWYAFTQFEDTDARRAFPCFDEPGWKTPWHLTLVVPAGAVAASNMPIASEEAIAAVAAEPARKGVPAVPATPAMKRVHFAPTPPLPTYLVAFAVGPFDVVDGGKAGKKGTQLRYLVPKGRAGEVGFAKEATPKLLEQLEDYFGQPYPYEKLDAVAIPVTVGFGAMENVGLITYEMPILVAKPEQETEPFKRRYAGTAAHEMAHQWFGDFVTMQWWNDTWLNESFATWMSAKVVERAYPAWQTRLSADEQRFQAMQVDRLASTRQIRQPVNTPDDLGNVFDVISYQKGSAVLSMFEAAIGEERFRNGVRRYVYEHANGSARAEDFYGAVAAEAGPDLATTVGGMKSFIEQPGVPRLQVLLDCGADGNSPPKLTLTQSRYLPSKPIGDPAFAQRWTFPACFQFGRGGDFNEFCTVITEPRTVVPLPAGESCPAWVLPNRGGSGYFVSSLTAELTQQLVRTPLLPSEAIPALDDAATLVGSGNWPVDLALDFAARFFGDRQVTVSEAAVRLAGEVRASWLEDPADREALARYVQKNFAAKARALGWTAKATDRDGDPVLRQRLLPWVADVGADTGLQREATKLSRDWVSAKAPFPPGARAVLVTAARFAQGAAGKELLDAYLEAMPRTTGADHEVLQAALGSFRDPTLAEAAFDALFNGPDARDGLAALQRSAYDEVTAGRAIHYLRGHYDATIRRLPEHSAASLPGLGDRLCDADARGEFDATFGERAALVPGGARNYAQASERIAICLAARQIQHATLKAFVAKQ